MADLAQDLADIFPTHRRVPAGGEDVEVSAITLGELPALLAALGDLGLAALANPVWLILNDPDRAATVIAALVRRPQEWIKALPLAEFATLFTAGIEVNDAFFVHAGPALAAAGARMSAPAGA